VVSNSFICLALSFFFIVSVSSVSCLWSNPAFLFESFWIRHFIVIILSSHAYSSMIACNCGKFYSISRLHNLKGGVLTRYRALTRTQWPFSAWQGRPVLIFPPLTGDTDQSRWLKNCENPPVEAEIRHALQFSGWNRIKRVFHGSWAGLDHLSICTQSHRKW
jgi:hypothetical protein